MIGFKVYYEIETGEVILTIPERTNSNATETTKEQDFIMFSVLAARNPEMVDFIQLPYGKFRDDFREAVSWWVDKDTKELRFTYPQHEPPQSIIAGEHYRLIAEQAELIKVQDNTIEVLETKNSSLERTQVEQDKIILGLLYGF